MELEYLKAFHGSNFNRNPGRKIVLSEAKVFQLGQLGETHRKSTPEQVSGEIKILQVFQNGEYRFWDLGHAPELSPIRTNQEIIPEIQHEQLLKITNLKWNSSIQGIGIEVQVPKLHQLPNLNGDGPGEHVTAQIKNRELKEAANSRRMEVERVFFQETSASAALWFACCVVWLRSEA
nr:hypothetical protein Iba_chr05eCG7030 [Ipomoea batatas]